MARGQRGGTATDETPDVQNTEAPAEVTPTEAPAEGTTDNTENTEAPAAAEAPKDEFSLDTFTEKVNEATSNADTTTGDVATAFIEAVTQAYRELPTKGRKAAKKAIADGLRDAVNDRNMPKARALMMLNDALTEGAAGTKAPAKPVDPTEAFVDQAVALTLARAVFISEVPEGVKENWRDLAKERVTTLEAQIPTYRDYLKAKAERKDGDAEVAEPEGLSDVVKAAFKLATGKGAGLKRKVAGGAARPAFQGEKRDIAKHIQSAFADKAPGDFLSVADIRNHKSDEYGDDAPSSGAISSRLFPASGKVTVSGVRPGEKDGKKGAFKA